VDLGAVEGRHALPVGTAWGTPLATSRHRMPSRAATAAVTRAWFDCTPPQVISVSAPCATASAPTKASFRTLFPPKPTGSVSSRLMSRRACTPRCAASRSIGSTGDGAIKERLPSVSHRLTSKVTSFFITFCTL
jgi:hypothetical protein